MKLLTHNFMTSKCIKGVNVGYPLGIVAHKISKTKVDFNPEFVCRMIPKLDWDALCQAAENVRIDCLNDLPKVLVPNYEADENFLRKVHHILLEVDVISGDLLCPETGRKFPITDGIPNMLLNEDEV
ncbi:multifunctional methyltransferase subunit TRM112-like protein isoform X1 [Centruroides sculpturatus]|uniref:multifunctional methyltransferase subunit TRM112-like protein isoform X1 n=1 Tax=Centruroides sculpturatus TaxID=218467 RepID=UPI000C6E1DA9|nr:multifunctional methyltransferase subunit TRM112-like protein isoform X1 [Centruroides sculpturatus]